MANINITNRKAGYEYELHEKFIAGIQLTGSEIKSIRAGKASLSDAYCYIHDYEVFIKSMHIAEYSHGGHYNHEPKRDRKLLLKKREIYKIRSRVEEKGFTLVPLRLFINERGFAKLEIAVAKGKKIHDKREAIKKKDLKRILEREI